MNEKLKQTLRLSYYALGVCLITLVIYLLVSGLIVIFTHNYTADVATLIEAARLISPPAWQAIGLIAIAFAVLRAVWVIGESVKGVAFELHELNFNLKLKNERTENEKKKNGK